MWKKLIKEIISKISTFISLCWHNFYFHWQLKDKTSFLMISAFIFVVISIPIFTFQLVEYKNVQHDIKCLTLNIFHEARSESEAGQRAVASVTLNRVASKHYPDTICDVVYEKRWDKIRKRYVGQFSWTEFDEPPKLKSKAWYRAWAVAESTYKDKDKTLLKGALFYHAKYIKPSWARKKKPIAKIGMHIFYK
ncbi:MAG: cell wall hydrolase [Gammaproteobacteria bacterium]|nr:cell wall hydrolase [Gammaproteobacteria bacterium]